MSLTTVYTHYGSILGDIDAAETGALSRLYREVYGPGQQPEETYFYTAHGQWVAETLGSGGAIATVEVNDLPAAVIRAWSNNLDGSRGER